ncbi:hypothetical protein CR513_52180, partial [Mucuna pruriens]
MMLAGPLVLTKLVEDTSILIYLSISNETISIMIVQEFGKEQRSVYFVSKVFQRVETRYQKIEKSTLALVPHLLFSRLRSYFQSNRVIVRTKLPFKQVLRKPNLDGQSNYQNLTYLLKKKGHIKVQALANFVTKLTLVNMADNAGKEWTLSIDEASNQKGGDIEIILEGPNEVMIGKSLQFKFKTRKNQMEYEAFDLQLVTSLLNKECHAKDPQLQATLFKKFTLLHVPRDQNGWEDLLPKLASTQRNSLNCSVIQKTLSNPTIEGKDICCIAD